MLPFTSTTLSVTFLFFFFTSSFLNGASTYFGCHCLLLFDKTFFSYHFSYAQLFGTRWENCYLALPFNDFTGLPFFPKNHHQLQQKRWAKWKSWTNEKSIFTRCKKENTHISKNIYIFKSKWEKRSIEKAREKPVNRHRCDIRVRVNGLWITQTKIRLKIHSIRIDWPESVFHFNKFSHSDSRKYILTLQYFLWQRCLPSGFWHIFYSIL